MGSIREYARYPTGAASLPFDQQELPGPVVTWPT